MHTDWRRSRFRTVSGFLGKDVSEIVASTVFRFHPVHLSWWVGITIIENNTTIIENKWRILQLLSKIARLWWILNSPKGVLARFLLSLLFLPSRRYVLYHHLVLYWLIVYPFSKLSIIVVSSADIFVNNCIRKWNMGYFFDNSCDFCNLRYYFR